ncbi:MAG: proline--tRNA ligase [Acidimicrobiia bacterium]|nr:proline--tRNA ligase [Acidimicrobiia bacterium]
MRWSQAFIPTLREDPADAEAPSHRLLMRAGFIRQLMSGVYSLLPLAVRSRAKIAAIIREEMDAIGCQEFLLPAIHPAEVWQKSGRWDTMGDEMFRLKDRRQADLVLGMTHEEVFSLIAGELDSYKELPQAWYQIQTKFRDEPRPRSGVLRTREFTMKDAYTFDIDDAGLDAAFELQRQAYTKIFDRLGFDAVQVEASSGAMGGTESVEFIVPAASGEDIIARCPNGDYSANLEKATSGLEPLADEPGPEAPQRFETPGVRTIDALVAFGDGHPSDRQIKTLVYVLDGEPALVLLRGDHQLQEQKLADATKSIEARPAAEDEVVGLLGAHPGSLGAVGLSDVRIVVDEALRGRSDMTTGANEDDFHLSGVSLERDIEVGEWHDLRAVEEGQPCPNCGSPLALMRGIEAGHIFKLGRKFAESIGVSVLDEEGKSQVVTMGSYGIGLERAMAAVVEVNHDDKGIIWPVTVAPYEVVITVLSVDQEGPLAAGEHLYQELRSAGVDVILDDRAERPGVKFTDAELIGFPIRITIGPKGLDKSVAEVQERRSGESEEIAIDTVAKAVSERIVAQRR